MPTTALTFAPEVMAYLDLHHIITLSTSSFTGLPHAATVAYASDETAMYFASAPDTITARNVRDNRYISFTIDDYTTDWRKVRELVGIGNCVPADDVESEQARALFDHKYGGTAVYGNGVMHRIRPGEIHFVDYDYTAVMGAPHATETTTRAYQLGGLADADLKQGAVSTNLDQRRVPAGEVIFRPGDQAGQFWVVASGSVELRSEGFGADQTVIRIGPGQMFGDRAAMHGGRGVVTAHAVEDTALMAVRPDSVRDLLLGE